MTDIVERLLTMENFYMDRPSVDQEVQTPTLTEVTERECDQIAILLHETRVEIERLRAALTKALEYEPVREDFQSSSKGDLHFAESQKVWAEMRSVLPSPPTQEGGE